MNLTVGPPKHNHRYWTMRGAIDVDVLSRWLFSVVEDRNDAARVLVRGRFREDINYDNFKDSVAERQGWDRHDAYLDVWSCMAKNARDDG